LKQDNDVHCTAGVNGKR